MDVLRLDARVTGIVQRGNTVTVMGDTGPLSADGSFVASDFAYTWQGVFATEGGTTVIRDGTGEYRGATGHTVCAFTFSATKQ